MRKLKTYFAIGIVLALAASVFLNFRSCKEIDRLSTNQDNYATGNHSGQVTLNLGEFKKYYEALAKLAKDYDIKPRQIEYVYQIVPEYRDCVRTVRNDSIVYLPDSTEVRYFTIDQPCYSIWAVSYPDSGSAQLFKTDTLTIIPYWYRKGCWVIRWLKPKFYDIIAHSACSGDTVAVIRNIKIKKGL